jgi:hypothetical protein
VELICQTEDISWQTFFGLAEERHPDLPLVARLRIEVTEYLRAAAGWFPEVSQPFAEAARELPLVGLGEAMVHGLVSSGHDGGAEAVSLDREVPLHAHWE